MNVIGEQIKNAFSNRIAFWIVSVVEIALCVYAFILFAKNKKETLLYVFLTVVLIPIISSIVLPFFSSFDTYFPEKANQNMQSLSSDSSSTKVIKQRKTESRVAGTAEIIEEADDANIGFFKRMCISVSDFFKRIWRSISGFFKNINSNPCILFYVFWGAIVLSIIFFGLTGVFYGSLNLDSLGAISAICFFLTAVAAVICLVYLSILSIHWDAPLLYISSCVLMISIVPLAIFIKKDMDTGVTISIVILGLSFLVFLGGTIYTFVTAGYEKDDDIVGTHTYELYPSSNAEIHILDITEIISNANKEADATDTNFLERMRISISDSFNGMWRSISNFFENINTHPRVLFYVFWGAVALSFIFFGVGPLIATISDSLETSLIVCFFVAAIVAAVCLIYLSILSISWDDPLLYISSCTMVISIMLLIIFSFFNINGSIISSLVVIIGLSFLVFLGGSIYTFILFRYGFPILGG